MLAVVRAMTVGLEVAIILFYAENNIKFSNIMQDRH